MILFFIVLLGLIFLNIKIPSMEKGQGKFFYNSLDRSSNQSTCIKGVFAFIIVLQHARQYFKLDSSFASTSFSFIPVLE